jgi:predicted nucleotidyltransferase
MSVENRSRILEEFFKNPNKTYSIREIEKRTRITYPSARNHIKKLEKDQYLIETQNGPYTGYKLADNQKTKIKKRHHLIEKLYETGLIDKLEEKTRPNSITLYGSAVDGNDDERGDIDILIQANPANISLTEYEKTINRKINILYEPKPENLQKEFKNNIINGITLKGKLKLIK